MNRVHQPAPPEAEPGRGLALAIPVGLLVITVGVWIYLVVNLLTLDSNACLSLPSRVPGFSFVLVALAGLLVGRYSGLLRYISSWNVEDLEEGGARSDKVGGWAVAIIFLALVPIFVYEAVGVYQPPNGLEPITYYVRCSIGLDNTYGSGYRTMGIFFLIGLLFGQWLWAWHPSENQFRGQLRSQLGDLFSQLANKRLWDVSRARPRRVRHERPKVRTD
jgi:hypothetical protein